jgi:hypothetical protein
MNPWSTVRGGPRDDETRGGKWRNGRWVRRRPTKAPSPADESKTAKGDM